MNVADVLKEKGTRIITVRMHEPVEVAARLMSSENIGALAVKDVVRTEGNTCVGMFSERDIVRALVEHGTVAMQMPVEKLMTKKFVSCAPNDELPAVMEKMDSHSVRHLPVIEDHSLIGVISVRDVIRVLKDQATVSGSIPAA